MIRSRRTAALPARGDAVTAYTLWLPRSDGKNASPEAPAGQQVRAEHIVVLHHGYTSRASVWDPLVESLSRHANSLPVLALDARGCGESSHEGPYTIEDFARDALALVDHVFAGAPRMHLVGHSMGSQIICEVASLAGPRVLSLSLVAPAPLAGFDKSIADPGYFTQRKKLRGEMQASEPAFQAALHAELGFLGRVEGLEDDDHRARAEHEARYLREQLRCSEAHYDEMWARMLQWRVRPDLIRGIPILFVIGATDSTLQPNLENYLMLRKNPATLCVLPRVSHGIPRDVPEQLALTLLDFWKHGAVSWRSLMKAAAARL